MVTQGLVGCILVAGTLIKHNVKQSSVRTLTLSGNVVVVGACQGLSKALARAMRSAHPSSPHHAAHVPPVVHLPPVVMDEAVAEPAAGLPLPSIPPERATDYDRFLVILTSQVCVAP